MRTKVLISFGLTAFALFGLSATPQVRAQAGAIGSTLTDQSSISVGLTGNAPEEFGYGPGFGSITTAKTVDGYSVVAFYDDVRVGSKVGGYFNTKLTVGGFVADPGQGWLTSAVAGSVTFTGSTAKYSYSSGQATWTFGNGPVFATATGAVAVTLVHAAAVADLNVKYKIMGVDYAPPGAKSSVSYNNSTVRGTDTSNSATWTNSTTLAVTVKGGANFIGLAHGTVTGSVSNTWSQEGGSSSEVIINSTTTNTDTVLGPSSSASGIDHDFDVIWVWLNPIVTIARGPGTIVNTGYDYNALDDAGEAEIVPLYVYYLKNPATIPAGLLPRLARSWDTSGVGGLTTTDYENILAADPFAVSATYDPNSDPAQRYDLQGGQTFNYVPAPPGGQPVTQSLAIAYTSTSKAGQEATNSTSTTFSVDIDTGASLIGSIDLDVKFANTYMNTDKWNSTIITGSGNTATLSITGPLSTDNYPGPTSIQVWRDNVYGSFMFFPVE